MLGHVINDRYKLIKTLGEGGFGVVYRARDLALSRDVAIKLLSLNAQKDPAQAERFMAEARITSKLHHPNLVTLYDSGQVQSVSTPNEHALVGQLFLVTELLLGASLERVLEHKVLDLPQTMSLLRQLAEGLAVAHAHGVIHRDIKPPNIFVHQVEGPGGNRERDGEGQGEVVKLLDFGIAKVADEQTHTLTGQLFGTPYYMSPEQIYGKKQLTHATDIYSLGVLTFHCLTGQVPFDGDSQYVIFNKHIHEAVPRLSLHHPELKRAEIQAVVEGLMEKRPQDRPQGALEVLELLDNLEALCPAWFEPPAPLLEGVPLNRGDTERVRLSELNTGALDMSALVFELTPPEGAGAGGGAGGAQEDDAGDAELELLGALAPSEPTRRSPPPRPPAPLAPARRRAAAPADSAPALHLPPRAAPGGRARDRGERHAPLLPRRAPAAALPQRERAARRALVDGGAAAARARAARRHAAHRAPLGAHGADEDAERERVGLRADRVGGAHRGGRPLERAGRLARAPQRRPARRPARPPPRALP
ncbi:MAG: serine/threonine protein kinase [Deltaproteobacteria bacterium]|nr:serine/threonine protein kinase [Deltaproteobacteria bacterium]